MDSKFLFLVGVMILILSTCSIDAAPAESGIDGQVQIGQMCPVVQEVERCPHQPYQAGVMITDPNGHMIE